jgi:tetratricopeptide (TPR) repeat protein
MARKTYFEGLNIRLEAERERRTILFLFRQALAIQKNALELNDKAAYVWNEIGITLFELGELEESDSCLNKAIALAPTWSIPYYNFLYHFSERGPAYYEQAESYGLKSMALQPDDFDIYLILADLYEKQERYEESVKMLKKCIELDPENSSAYNDLGFIYKNSDLGTNEEAEKLFLTALEKDSTDMGAHYNLGQLYRDEYGKNEESITHFRRYIQLEPEDPDGYNELGLTLDEFPDKAEEAEAMYIKANEVDPGFPYGFYNQAHLYSHELNRPEEAITLFKKYNENEPEDPDGYFEIACIHSELGNLEEALLWLQQAFDRDFSDQEKLMQEVKLENLRSNEAFQSLLKEHFGN